LQQGIWFSCTPFQSEFPSGRCQAARTPTRAPSIYEGLGISGHPYQLSQQRLHHGATLQTLSAALHLNQPRGQTGLSGLMAPTQLFTQLFMLLFWQ
jgi:hypothetical protein